MPTIARTVRHCANAALLLLLAISSASAQTNSRSAAVGMMATVLPNLKLQPKIFAVRDNVVSANIAPEGSDRFLVHAQITGEGKALLRIPVWLSSNVKSFILSAASSDSTNGTVQMVSSGSDKISLLSNPKPLQSSPIFALGLPAAGRLSAGGTLDGTIEIALAGLADGGTKEISIRVNIGQNGTSE